MISNILIFNIYVIVYRYHLFLLIFENYSPSGDHFFDIHSKLISEISRSVISGDISHIYWRLAAIHQWFRDSVKNLRRQVASREKVAWDKIQ